MVKLTKLKCRKLHELHIYQNDDTAFFFSDVSLQIVYICSKAVYCCIVLLYVIVCKTNKGCTYRSKMVQGVFQFPSHVL